MSHRLLSIWFPYLATDHLTRHDPGLRFKPFVLRKPFHNQMVISAMNEAASKAGLHHQMPVADARALVPELEVQDEPEGITKEVLEKLAEWCIRFTPVVALDPPEGLLLDASGCTHLWEGDKNYLRDVRQKLLDRGYTIRMGMADTATVAWGLARYGRQVQWLPPQAPPNDWAHLPPEALRLDGETVDRLHKLGLHFIRDILSLSRTTLRRRFGPVLLEQLDKASGVCQEYLVPVAPMEPFEERLPCLEPIVNAAGIEIAIHQLLENICLRLMREEKGARQMLLTCYRVDGHQQDITVSTHQPTHHVSHLVKLFETHIAMIEPDLGIELFVMTATLVEEHRGAQEDLWQAPAAMTDSRINELMDRIAIRLSPEAVQRYKPNESFWPERAIQPTQISTSEEFTWPVGRQRPLYLLPKPEALSVTAPIPDYPPMNFRLKGKLHEVVKADGPERIEQEWWLSEGKHRDYYIVEDKDHQRFWLFRSGHYHDKDYQWFLHGFFA